MSNDCWGTDMCSWSMQKVVAIKELNEWTRTPGVQPLDVGNCKPTCVATKVYQKRAA